VLRVWQLVDRERVVVAIVSEERGGGGVPLVLCVRLRRIFPQLSQVEPPPPESKGKARSTYTSMLLQLLSLDRAMLPGNAIRLQERTAEGCVGEKNCK
jgi:hypothetical protein